MTRERRSISRLPRRYRLVLGALVGGLLGLLSDGVVAQQEISLFKLVDVKGQFSMRYLLDDVDADGLANTSFATSGRLQEEFRVNTRSYVYHPAFLGIQFSASPIFVQSDYDSNLGGTKTRESLFGYDARFDFLSRKKYPFSAWFTRAHPEVSTGLSGRYRTTSKEYGIGGRLELPVQVSWRASHQAARGSGFGAIVDSDNDTAFMRFSLPYKRKNNVNLTLDWLSQNSSSGSPGLPIRPTSVDMFSSELVGKNVFGADNQFRLNQRLLKRHQETKGTSRSDFDTLLYSAFLDWDPDSNVSSSSSYQYSDVKRIGISQTSHVLVTGANFRFQNGVVVGGNLRAASLDSTSVDRDRFGGNFSARYSLDLPFGDLALLGSVRAARTSQESSSDRFRVFDETVRLNGVTPVELREEFVVEGSVMVTNVDRTQTYIPNVDYRLNEIGSTTTIERLVGGNILDGEDVLISYEALTGGTVKYGSTSESVGANLAVSPRTSLFLRLANSDNEVLSGAATTPLNDSRQFEVGGKSSRPVGLGWSLGGEIRYLHQDEEISPSVRQQFDVYLQSPTFWNTRARFGLKKIEVDYKTSREDVDRMVYTLTVDSRLDGGIYLTYRGVSSDDDGGSILREDVRHTVRISWRYRLVDFSLNASRSEITQGATRRNTTRLTAELRRFF